MKDFSKRSNLFLRWSIFKNTLLSHERINLSLISHGQHTGSIYKTAPFRRVQFRSYHFFVGREWGGVGVTSPQILHKSNVRM